MDVVCTLNLTHLFKYDDKNAYLFSSRSRWVNPVVARSSLKYPGLVSKFNNLIDYHAEKSEESYFVQPKISPSLYAANVDSKAISTRISRSCSSLAPNESNDTRPISTLSQRIHRLHIIKK